MHAILLAAALLAVAPVSRPAPALELPVPVVGAIDEPRFLYFVIEGDGKERPPVVSRVMQYTGFDRCQRLPVGQFVARSRDAFSDHLKSRHKEHFPEGAGDGVQVIDRPEYPKQTANPYFETRAEASQRRSQWIKAQREKGLEVVETTFSITCSQANRR